MKQEEYFTANPMTLTSAPRSKPSTSLSTSLSTLPLPLPPSIGSPSPFQLDMTPPTSIEKPDETGPTLGYEDIYGGDTGRIVNQNQVMMSPSLPQMSSDWAVPTPKVGGKIGGAKAVGGEEEQGFMYMTSPLNAGRSGRGEGSAAPTASNSPYQTRDRDLGLGGSGNVFKQPRPPVAALSFSPVVPAPAVSSVGNTMVLAQAARSVSRTPPPVLQHPYHHQTEGNSVNRTDTVEEISPNRRNSFIPSVVALVPSGKGSMRSSFQAEPGVGVLGVGDESSLLEGLFMDIETKVS